MEWYRTRRLDGAADRGRPFFIERQQPLSVLGLLRVPGVEPGQRLGFGQDCRRSFDLPGRQ